MKWWKRLTGKAEAERQKREREDERRTKEVTNLMHRFDLEDEIKAEIDRLIERLGEA